MVAEEWGGVKLTIHLYLRVTRTVEVRNEWNSTCTTPIRLNGVDRENSLVFYLF